MCPSVSLSPSAHPALSPVVFFPPFSPECDNHHCWRGRWGRRWMEMPLHPCGGLSARVCQHCRRTNLSELKGWEREGGWRREEVSACDWLQPSIRKAIAPSSQSPPSLQISSLTPKHTSAFSIAIQWWSCAATRKCPKVQILDNWQVHLNEGLHLQNIDLIHYPLNYKTGLRSVVYSIDSTCKMARVQTTVFNHIDFHLNHQKMFRQNPSPII